MIETWYEYQPIPDERELPAELWNPDLLFDPYVIPEPQDMAPDTEADYEDRIHDIPTLTDDEARALAARARDGDIGAAEELFTRHLRMAAWFCRMTMNYPGQRWEASEDPDERRYPGTWFGNLADFAHYPLPLMDRVQIATYELWRRVGAYDPDGRYAFRTVAMGWMEQAVTRAIFDYGERSGAKLSNELSTQARTIRLSERYLSRTGKRVTVADIAADTGMHPYEVAIFWWGNHVHDTEQLSVAEEEYPLADTVMDIEEDVETEALERYQLSLVMEELDDMDERDGSILRMRFGIGYDRVQKLTEVGEEWGITPERVRQLEMKAMEKLRERMRRRWQG